MLAMVDSLLTITAFDRIRRDRRRVAAPSEIDAMRLGAITEHRQRARNSTAFATIHPSTCRS